MFDRFSRMTIGRKLFIVIGIMIVLITMELFSLWFAISTLSSVRSYVGGEGLWAKAQKDAVYNLRKYAADRTIENYNAFHELTKVQLGDREAREAMNQVNFDYDLAFNGFIKGQNNPADVPGLISLYRRFNQVSYMRNAIDIWEEADAVIVELISAAEELHKQVASKNPDTNAIQQKLNKVDAINAKLTGLENDFSYTLGEASRWMESLLMKVLILMALTIEVSALVLTTIFTRQISIGIQKMNDAAKKVATGDFTTKVVLKSKDDLGELGDAFNNMTDALKTSEEEKLEALKVTEAKTLQMREAKDRAEKSERVKEQFLANMSHEIRTPLNGIIGFTRLLEDTALTDEQKEYLKIIETSGNNLLVIVNDILDVAKIESGRMALELNRFSVKETLRDSVNLLRHKAIEKGVELDFLFDETIPEEIKGDRVRVSQILINLIGNAVKFTDKGKVTVETKLIESNNDYVDLHFTVTDTGIGVEEDRLEYIFESFSQIAGNQDKLFGGTGLGLTITKQLVEMMGGEITVKSELGVGSVFSFNLKFISLLSEVYQKTENNYRNFDENKVGGKRILIVDDNDSNKKLVMNIVGRWNAIACTACNGLEAINEVDYLKPDVVLMDLKMPLLDGYGATKEIRKKYSSTQLPIIALTAHAMTGERSKCLAAGMNGYISKPFEPEELKRIISKLL